MWQVWLIFVAIAAAIATAFVLLIIKYRQQRNEVVRLESRCAELTKEQGQFRQSNAQLEGLIEELKVQFAEDLKKVCFKAEERNSGLRLENGHKDSMIAHLGQQNAKLNAQVARLSGEQVGLNDLLELFFKRPPLQITSSVAEPDTPCEAAYTVEGGVHLEVYDKTLGDMENVGPETMQMLTSHQ